MDAYEVITRINELKSDKDKLSKMINKLKSDKDELLERIDELENENRELSTMLATALWIILNKE